MWEALLQTDAYRNYRNSEGRRAEIYLFPSVKQEILKRYPDSIVLSPWKIPPKIRKKLFGTGGENIDLSEIQSNEFDKSSSDASISKEKGFDVAIFAPTPVETDYYYNGQFYAFLPLEIKTNAENLNNSSTETNFLKHWRDQKRRWGHFSPFVILVTIEAQKKTDEGEEIPNHIWQKLKSKPCSEATRENLNLETIELLFHFRHPEKVLKLKTKTSDSKLSDISRPRPWIPRAIKELMQMIKKGQRVIGVVSFIGTGKSAFIAKILKEFSFVCIATFHTIQIANQVTGKYNDKTINDLLEVNHKSGHIQSYLDEMSAHVSAMRKVKPLCICKSTLKTELPRILQIAQNLELERQKMMIILDEAHKYNDLETIHRLTSQPNIIIVLVTATNPLQWRKFSDSQNGHCWQEISNEEFEYENEEIFESKVFATLFDKTLSVQEKRYVVPIDVKLSSVNDHTIISSCGRFFRNVPLDLSQYFGNLHWIQGMTAIEAVEQNVSMGFNLKFVDRGEKTRIESLLDYVCERSNARNALILTTNKKHAKKAENILLEYGETADGREIKVKRLYDKIDERNEFDNLCADNLESGDYLVVLIAIFMLDVGGDLPMVDTTIMDQSMSTNSNLQDYMKLIQLCRNMRVCDGKFFVETVLENETSNVLAASHLIQELDPSFQITEICRDTLESHSTRWFQSFLDDCTTNEKLKNQIKDHIENREKKQSMDMWKHIFPSFVEQFSKRKPFKDECFTVKGFELDACSHQVKIVTELSRRWERNLNDEIISQVKNIIWLYEAVERPKAPSHITLDLLRPEALKKEYQYYLEKQSNDPLPVDEVKTLIRQVVYSGENKQKTCDLLDSLFSESAAHTIRCKQTKQNITIDLETTTGGIKYNTNCLEVCEEIRKKIPTNKELGNGGTSFVANKILLWQLLDSRTSKFSQEWLENRIREIEEYSEKKKQYEEKFKLLKKDNERLEKKRKSSGSNGIEKFLKPKAFRFKNVSV